MIQPKSNRYLCSGVALTAAIVGTSGFHAQSLAQSSLRQDGLANLRSDGFAVMTLNDFSVTATVTGGKISLKTDDIHCDPTPTHICTYTLNELNVTLSDFVWDDRNLTEGKLVVNDVGGVIGPLTVQDDGNGILIPEDTPVTFTFKEDGSFTRVDGKAPRSFKLRMNPTAQKATVYGSFFEGSLSGVSLRAAVAVNALSPFVNMPPKAEAGPDQTVSCGLATHLDGSGSTDVNDDIVQFKWSEKGSVVASGAQVNLPLALGTHVLTLTVVDSYGGQNTDTVTVNVIPDTTKPVFTSVPGPGTIGSCNNPDIGAAAAIDNCGGNVIVDHSPKTFLPGTTTVTWTATDASGNSATALQIVTTAKPTFTSVPSNVTINSCSDPYLGEATAVDVCGEPVTSIEHSPKVFLPGTTTVTWIATDSSGNSSTATQSVTTGPPVFVSKPPAVTFTECERQNPDIGKATAVDVCGSVVEVTNTPKEPFPIGSTTVTWTAKDSAGTISTYPQRVTITAATDLGGEHNVSSIKNNACVVVTKYPSWAPHLRTIIIQPQAAGVGWPLPFTYANCGTNYGSGTLPGPWLQDLASPVSTTCPTLIKFGGNGAGSVSLTWWGNG
jgi:hypothetical protein